MTKVLALLKNPKVLHTLGAFLTALLAQPSLAAAFGGSVPFTTNLLVSALVGAVVAVLQKYLPKAQ